MNCIFFKNWLSLFFILMFSFSKYSYSQIEEKAIPQIFKNKLFVKVGISSDYDWTSYWGHNYSLGYGRNLWKNLSINIFYTHCQTNTLKGSFRYYTNPYEQSSYIDRYLGITLGEYFSSVATNGLSVHDAFCLKAAYDFKIGKHFYISPFLGIAYGWSKFNAIYIDSAHFENNMLTGGSVGFEYQQGKVFGPDIGMDMGYTFKNKHHQLFFQPELILLTTPGDPVVLSTYEAVQFSIGYNYKF